MIKILVKDVLNFIDSFAPFNMAEDFDNVGLLVGNLDEPVYSILLCLDVTREVLKMAKEKSVSLIVSHHPIIFNPIKSVLEDDLVYMAVKYKISVICAHTNLDKAFFGVASCLARAINLTNIEVLKGSSDCARIGNLEQSFSCLDFIKYISKCLHVPVRAVATKRKIKRVAVSPGSGCFALDCALKEKADAFVTGESKHEILIKAKECDICFVDASHFATENIILNPLAKKIKEAFKDEKVLIFNSNQKSPALYVFGDIIWD